VSFRTSFSESTFNRKYGHLGSWSNLAKQLVDDVCGSFQGKGEPILSKDERDRLTYFIETMKFIPGGRYLYYAGRPMHAWNNCFLLKGEEDTREEWGNLKKRASDCLMLGGGIGADYSVFRCKNTPLKRTGGLASGPIPLMNSINEIGRNVMQGGSRRSAIYASLNWQHGDIQEFLRVKNWHEMPVGKAKKRDGSPYTIADAKKDDFNFPAPLDMTNISVNYDDEWLFVNWQSGKPAESRRLTDVFIDNCFQALSTGEPGFSFNFGTKQNETLRNACTEVTSEDDSDVCNLGSVNFAAIDDIPELAEVVNLASRFLVCGTLRADLPYQKVAEVRAKNRRLGLGLMGLHEWLLKRGHRYEVVEELHYWLNTWKLHSQRGADELCDRLSISRPVAYRAIAPTGTIGILAATTTGIEPLYAVAYKRRFLSNGTHWKYEYVVDATADHLIKTYGLDPDSIETAASLAADPERRIKFQADVQDYVDMSISSTINLPAWGTDLNNEDKVKPFAAILAKYAPRLRGFTCYPDGSRGGQPLTPIPYKDAVNNTGVEFAEHDICDITKHGGSCG
jgi:ribonucleoside-diphosphate reductase alpha chain